MDGEQAYRLLLRDGRQIQQRAEAGEPRFRAVVDAWKAFVRAMERLYASGRS